MTTSPGRALGTLSRRSSIWAAVGSTSTLRRWLLPQGCTSALACTLPGEVALASKRSWAGWAASTVPLSVVSPLATRPLGRVTRRLTGNDPADEVEAKALLACAVKVTTSPTHTWVLSATKLSATSGLTCTRTRVRPPLVTVAWLTVTCVMGAWVTAP